MKSAAGTPGRSQGEPPLSRGWRPHIFEIFLYLIVYILYLLTKGLVFSGEGAALDNAHRVISLEKTLGIFWEPSWQSWALENARALVLFLDWVYIITYFPVILAAALALYLVNRRLYYYYRTVIVINLLMALVVFTVLPTAPPLKISPFVDTIQTVGPSFYGGPEMADLRNANAAMPSQHFSWTVILGILYLRTVKGKFRLLGLGYPALTLLSIIITGNHYILDAVVGGIMAGMAFALVELWRRRRSLQLQWVRILKLPGRQQVRPVRTAKR